MEEDQELILVEHHILSNSLNDEPTLVVCMQFFRYEIITFNEIS